MSDMFEHIRKLAGPQRALTFDFVARVCMQFGATRYVETGCYRGDGRDGQSTFILGLLAQKTGGTLESFDICEKAIERAKALTAGYPVSIKRMDSVDGIRGINYQIDVLYLDSYDYDEANPAPCQAHQLLEAAAAIPKMSDTSIILLDDCSLPNGGKAKLSDVLIRILGFVRWSPHAQLYQNAYYRGFKGL